MKRNLQHDPVACGHVADVQCNRRLRSILCEGQGAVRLQRRLKATASWNLRS